MARGPVEIGAPSGSAHNPWLDLLRSVAIVLVLLRHGYRSTLNQFGIEPGPAGNAMLNGWVGVDLFLVLSGYLIGRQLLRGLENSATFDWQGYLLRRGFRIVPSYVAVLALVMLGAFPLYVIPREALAFRGFYHLLFLQDYLPPDINIVFWTLGVEEKFYLVAPLLIAVCLRAGPLRTRLLILALVFFASPLLRALTLVGSPLPLDYPTYFHGFRSPFHACLEPLAAGVAIALAERAGALHRLASSGLAILAAAALALVFWLASHDLLDHIVTFDVVLQPDARRAPLRRDGARRRALGPQADALRAGRAGARDPELHALSGAFPADPAGDGAGEGSTRIRWRRSGSPSSASRRWRRWRCISRWNARS